jgi:hypothetical protein
MATSVELDRDVALLASVSGNPAVLHHVGHDQRQREEEEAEDEVAEPAVPFSARNPGGPERNHNPDDHPDDPLHTRLLLFESARYLGSPHAAPPGARCVVGRRHLRGFDFEHLGQHRIRGTIETRLPTVSGPVGFDTTVDAHYHDERALGSDLAAALNAQFTSSSPRDVASPRSSRNSRGARRPPPSGPRIPSRRSFRTAGSVGTRSVIPRRAPLDW